MSNPIASFDEQAVKDELREPVGKTIEETINEMYLAGGRRGSSRTSARSCGARASPPARSPT